MRAMKCWRPLLLGLVLLLGLPGGALAASAWSSPQRVGLALYNGVSYNPGAIRFHLVEASVVYDYASIWGHRAPKALSFKVDAGLGVAHYQSTRLVAATGVMARYYLDAWAGPSFRPYGEAGIGLIYTDFQVPKQALRVNFNPRFGLGAEFGGPSRSWYAALQGHHLSNGHLRHNNRGINSVFFELGRYF